MVNVAYALGPEIEGELERLLEGLERNPRASVGADRIRMALELMRAYAEAINEGEETK